MLPVLMWLRLSPNSVRILPAFRDVGIVAVVADEWSDRWMSRHQILTRLSTHFHVLWMNPALDWRASMLRAPSNGSNGYSDTTPGNFHVYEAEPWLPRFYSPHWLANFTFRSRLMRAQKILRSKGCRKMVLYVWHPEFAASLDLAVFDLTCYHIVDEYSFSQVEVPISEQEKRLLDRADHVFVHTQALMEKQGKLSRSVSLIPNGVAYSQFATPAPEPSDLVTIPRPRIGYAGFLKNTLDWNLLFSLVEQHQQYSFVFVGQEVEHPDVRRGLQRLSEFRNVYLLGAVSSLQMAKYPQHFDVAIMPYVLNSYTSYIYPLKLHEYLASGCPVVGTPTRLLREFEKVIRLSETVEGWSAAIAESLAPAANGPAAREARQDVARRYDWDLLSERIAETFCLKLSLL